MNNEVYERDYSQDSEVANQPLKDDLFSHVSPDGFFKIFGDALRAMPKYIVPEDKKAYDSLLPRLDSFAKQWHGKIREEINYQRWDAHITVELPFLEFSTPEDYSLLSEIASTTNNVTLTATEQGGVKLYIMINYFDEIGDTENLISESLLQDEQLTEYLLQRHEDEKAKALSNPAIADFLDQHSSRLGLTSEELYDLIDDAYQSNPEKFWNLLFGKGQISEDDTEKEE